MNLCLALFQLVFCIECIYESNERTILKKHDILIYVFLFFKATWFVWLVAVKVCWDVAFPEI